MQIARGVIPAQGFTLRIVALCHDYAAFLTASPCTSPLRCLVNREKRQKFRATLDCFKSHRTLGRGWHLK